MPFYPITTKGEDKPRAVEADNPAAALRHVAEAAFTVGKPMKPAEIVAYMREGGTVETAGAEQDPAA